MATIKAYEIASGKRYRVRYRKPDGSQTDKRGFKTKKAAELYAATVEVRKASGDFVDPTLSRERLSDLGNRWLATRTHLKPSSRAAYESAWRLHVEPQWGARQIGSISHSEVQAWLAQLHAGDEQAKQKPKSATLVRRCHDIMAGIFDAAVDDRRIPKNIVRGSSLPRKLQRARIYLTHEQVWNLAAKCGEHSTLVLLLAYAGLRWGEVTALRVRDVDLKRGRLSVVENAVYVKGRIVVGTPKTHEARTTFYPEFLGTRIRDACASKQDEDLLFPGADGGYHITPTIRRNSWWDKACASLGKPDMTIHDLRHTAASLAISSGANPKVVQRMLGHASAAMTLDLYADLFDDDLDSVAKRMDRAAKRSVGKMWANSAENDDAATS